MSDTLDVLMKKPLSELSDIELAAVKTKQAVNPSFRIREIEDRKVTERQSAELHIAELLQGDITAEEIQGKTYPVPRWIVPELLPEGLAIIAGAPKVGKSWLALNLGLAVSLGGRALGKIEVERREVLYLALEDTERRIRRRLDTLKAFPSTKLFIRCFWPRGEEALQDLRLWLQEHTDCGLVIIDTMGKIRKPAGDVGYQDDVDFMAGLKRIADGRCITLLLIHHCRKAAAEDFLDLVSGTNGIAGSADTIWVLQRARGTTDAVLSITGRDIEERELALRYDLDVGWTILGDAKELKRSQERQEIIRTLRESDHPMKPHELAELLEKNASTVKVMLWKMSKEGEVSCSGGCYSVPK
jgi:RecA-family ATPase